MSLSSSKLSLERHEPTSRRASNVGIGAPLSEEENAMTLDDMLDIVGFGRFQIKILLLCGLCWMADAVEIMVLGYLVPAAHEEFGVSEALSPLLASAVFVGMWLGLSLFGMLADRSGRRIVYVISLSIVLVFGVASSFSPSFTVLVLTRVLVGFGVGGSGVAFTMFSEFLPVDKRGEYLVWIELFWTVGTLVGAGIAWGTLSQLSWRWMAGLSALPALVPLIFFRWLYESPRHLAVSGQQDKAMMILREAAIENKTRLPSNARLVVHVENKRGLVREMFAPERRTLSLCLMALAFVNCFAYYGLVIVTPSYFESLHGSGSSDADVYIEVFIVSAAEFPGILAAAYMINKIGRRKTQAILLAITGVTSLALIAHLPSWGLIMFAMLVRAAILGAYSALLVYTVEVYPTHLRATAYGICGSFSRIAGMITPFIAAIQTDDGLYTIPLSIYGVTCFIAALIAIYLPLETTGLALDGAATNTRSYQTLSGLDEDSSADQHDA